MHGQQMQLPSYQHMTGAVQIPLLMLVWGALVLFFGHQYQANALLPSEDRLSSVAALEADDLLRAQQRHERLLARLAVEVPIQVPSLLDRKNFAADLAAELAASDLSKGVWQPGLPESVDELQTVSVVEVTPHSAPRSAPFSISSSTRRPALKPADTRIQRPVALPVTKSVVSRQDPVSKSPPTQAPKFVRLPAKVQAKAIMRVDALRISKDRARAELLAGRSSAAYVRLRGKIAKGRTDIEFLGLLALASLQQQPAEAEVIYAHLVQLQPDSKRWQQGLEQSLLLLASPATEPNEVAPSKRSPDVVAQANSAFTPPGLS